LETGLVSEEDRRDIEASLDGDEAAYARLVRRYEPLVSAQMRRFTRDARPHQELVQAAFVQVYLRLPRFHGRAPFLHWVRRIATRTGYHHWKRETRERRRREALEQAPMKTAEMPANPDPSEAAEYLYGLLEDLPAADRLVLTLLYFEECDTREIAGTFGVAF